MRNPEAFAFFFEETELRELFQGWPEKMRLVACLDTAGDCSLLVYREEESDRIIAKISKAFGIPQADVCLVPQVAGYPTKKILFSEEQKLLKLVEDVENLQEIAADYSLNFTFAQEEGLDPDLLMGGPRKDAPVEAVWAQPVNAPAEPSSRNGPPAPTVFSSSTTSSSEGTMRFGPKVPAPPVGFWPVGNGVGSECRFADCDISLLDNGSVCVVIGAAHSMAAKRINVAYVNDNLQSFALPTDAALMVGGADIALKVIVPARLFPRTLLTRIGAAIRAGTAIYVEGVFYIIPSQSNSDAMAPAPPSAADVAGSRYNRARIFLNGAVSGVATLSVILLLFKMGVAPELSETALHDAYMEKLQQDVFRGSENQ